MISILLTTNIISSNKESATLTVEMFKSVKVKGTFLTYWNKIHERIFGTTHNILDADKLILVKLADYGIITINTCNTCNTAGKIDKSIGKQIVEMARPAIIQFNNNNNKILLLLTSKLMHIIVINVYIRLASKIN